MSGIVSNRFIWFIVLIIHVLDIAEGQDKSSIRGKDGPNILKIGMIGTTPYFFVKDGRIMGSDLQLVQLFSKKMGFSYKLTVVPAFERLVFMVRWRKDD